ncbi:MAG: radical SAM/SPASM domain-containing protein [Fusobacteriaceae bacterium]
MKKKWKIGWGCVSKCNMKCAFCYSAKVRSEVEDLEFKDWKKFIDENHQSIDSLNYGTGENSLDHDWFILVDYIRKNYPSITQALTTNGYISYQMNKNEEYERIVKESIDEIDVSLDFYQSELHNEFRGQEKAFDWVLETLRLCQKHDISSTIVFIGINLTLEKENIKGLFEIAKKYGAKLRMNLYRPTNGIIENNIFIPDYKKIIDILYFIDENYKILAICDPLFSSILTENSFKKDPSGSESLRVLSDGSITPSTYLISEEFRLNTIKEKDILEKIETNEYINFLSNLKTPVSCDSCKFIKSCNGGVIDRRYLWFKNFSEKDPYCPFRDENFIPEKKIKITDESDFSSVHDGYLPTMFFSY